MADNAELLTQLKNRIDTRLNDCLSEMMEDYDDSIVGFNVAWDIVRKAFAEEIAGAVIAKTEGRDG